MSPVPLISVSGAPRPVCCLVSGAFAKSFDPSGTWPAARNFAQTDYWRGDSSSSAKGLQRIKPRSSCPKGHRRGSSEAAKGWTPERRARQAALIRRWAPWRRSTGPKTESGKARCARNALRHGFRSSARTHELQRVRYVLRLAAQNIKRLRLLIQLRRSAARPRIKYKPSRACLPARRPWREQGSRAILQPKYGGETCGHSQP
jgi:hypothetical protein